jgi:hypothetical protein
MWNKILKIHRLIPEFINAARYAVAAGKLRDYLVPIAKLLTTRLRRGHLLPEYLVTRIPARAEYTSVVSIDVLYENRSGTPLTVRLPGGNLEVDTVIDWDFATDDQEASFALHRFGWLLNSFVNSETTGDDVVAIVCDWIGRVPCQSGAKGWDSYSVSERLVNWILLLENLQVSGLAQGHVDEIRQSISMQVEYLWHRLEYRGGDTNNHLINNARALYIAGCYLCDEDILAVGRSILEQESERMFFESGFLREGSSHYQLLLARTFLEVIWFAKKNSDTVFLLAIEDRVKKIWHAACFFLQDYQFPVFGDLSPDFTPDFHFGIGVVGSLLFGEKSVAQIVDGNGWHTLFPGVNEYVVSNDVGSVKGLTAYPDAGYYRYSNNIYTLYIYVNPTGHVPGWSHGHADIGNFILYWKDRSVLIGTGRSSYRDTPEGRYGRSVRSHNAIAVDGREPCIVHGLNGIPAAMSQAYLQPPPTVDTDLKNGVLKISIAYAGMARWIDSGEVRREFECQPEELVISDAVHGKGRHQIDTYFQIPGYYHLTSDGHCLKMHDKDFALSLDHTQGMEVDTVVGRSGQTPLGWCSGRYGELQPIKTLVCHQTGDLPVVNHYQLSEQLHQS